MVSFSMISLLRVIVAEINFSGAESAGWKYRKRTQTFPLMPLRFECPPLFFPTPDNIKLPTDEVKFVCPSCKRKLSATPDQFGMEMSCPFTDCEEMLHVPDGGFTPIPVPPREN
jgi:hypothetical protein